MFTANFPTIASSAALERFDPVALNLTAITDESDCESRIRIVQLRAPGSASESPVEAASSGDGSRPLSGDSAAGADGLPGGGGSALTGASKENEPVERTLSGPSEGVQQLLASLDRVEQRPHMFVFLEDTLHSSPEYLSDLRSIFRMLRESYSAISSLTDQV